MNGYTRVGKADDFDDGSEFWVGGEVWRSLPEGERERLKGCGVHHYDSPQKLIADLSNAALGEAA